MISQAAQHIRGELIRDALDETPIVLKRRQWEESTQGQPTPSGFDICHLKLGGVTCLSCVPEKLKSKTTIVYFHGGGLVEGSTETHRNWTCRLALHTGCRVLSIEYRLAPEHPYPAASDDVTSVCHALAASIEFADGFCIGADSTGCILGLLALLKLRASNGNSPNCAFLLSPSIDLTFSGESIEFNASLDPLVSLDVLEHCSRLYAGSRDKHDPDISPLFAELKDIPPLLLMVDDHEILLDDAKRLAIRVEKAGGKAKLYVTHGLWHVWPIWGDFPESVIALDMIAQHINDYGQLNLVR